MEPDDRKLIVSISVIVIGYLHHMFVFWHEQQFAAPYVDQLTFIGDILTIRVGRCTDEISASWHTIWNNRLETRSEIKLAKISENFYTTLEEGKRMAEVRYSRWCNRKCNDRKELGDAYKSIALRWLRRQPHMKSCKLEDIDRMIRRTRSDDTVCFEIEAKGKTFYLHA